MNYLVDANVLSEPIKLMPDARVIEWLSAHEGEIVVDPIILGEMKMGILALPRGRKRTCLERWFKSVVETIDCLAWDANISLRWARLVVDLRSKGQAMPMLDSMIAATALVHDLIVVTRNLRDFSKAGVRTLDPFA